MESSEASSSPPESPIDLQPSRSTRSSFSEQTRKTRRSKNDRNNAFTSIRDVAGVLIARERETVDLKRTLYTLSDQLKAERLRADAAEAKTREVIAHFKAANEAKLAAEQASARANEELRLYKLQYDNAQEEIKRAQKLIDSLENQRVEAEEAAAKARSTARKLREEKIILRAREEGRRQGLEEGLAQGRALGFEEGRMAGIESARATERAYSAPATEMDYETPRMRHYEPPRALRASSSEGSDHGRANNYTQALDNNLPNPPPVTTPARIPSPAAPVAPQPERPVEQEIRPVSVHNVFSPSHPPVEAPPDGWIPRIDDDMRIRLPPPHEMGPQLPTSPSPPLSAVLNNVKNIPDEPVMIPPPANPEPEPSRRPKHRRRNSTESQSTTMSQFEILGPPSMAPMPRSTTRERPNVLSAIAEERERTSSGSSPVYGQSNLSTQSFQMPSPTPGMPVPSPSMPPPPQNPTYPDTTPRYRSAENLARSSEDYYRERTETPRYGGSESAYRSGGPRSASRYSDRDDSSRAGSAYGGRRRDGESVTRPGTSSSIRRNQSQDNFPRIQNIYAPPHSPHSSPDSPSPGIPPPAIVVPQPGLRPPPQPQHAPDNRGSMSSNEISFTVEPPSRPESNISRADGSEPHRSFLSADDADRPLPSTPTEPDPPPAPASPVIPSTVMLNGPYPPPGFVPMGPPTPTSTIGPAGVPLPPSSYGGSTVGPAGVPLPPSVYGGTPSIRSDAYVHGGYPGGEGPPPVIPLQPSSRSSQSGSGRNTAEPYTRSAIKRRDDDTDSSVSSGLGSVDSLTTPPARTRKLSRSSTPAYAAAPVPPNVTYPVVPPTPRSSTSMSLGSHTSRAARVPLPSSLSGSVVGSAVGGPPTRSSSVLGGRSRSPMMGGARNLSSSPSFGAMPLPVPEVVIPIPIPEPTPITEPVVIPRSPRRPTTPLADIEPVPVIPPRAPSPMASTVTTATGVSAGTRGKKGKKKR